MQELGVLHQLAAPLSTAPGALRLTSIESGDGDGVKGAVTVMVSQRVVTVMVSTKVVGVMVS